MKDTEAAVDEMHLHGACDGCFIESFADSKKLLFGWRCTCGEEWVFQLLPFKGYGIYSKWGGEMRTWEGRRKLIWEAKSIYI